MQSGQDWAGGYITDIAYTAGYYAEMNPVRAQLPLLLAGIAPPPRFETACELGFGLGVSLAVHATASDTQWYGCDVNPSHVAHANGLMRAGGVSPGIHAQGFEEFCARTDLPEFDFIGLHGIWTWIDEKYRTILADFFARKLRVGGVLYVSYNTLPGWAPFEPIRQILSQHVYSQSAQGLSLPARMEAALEHVARLIDADAAFIKANPGVKEKFERIRKLDRRYLVHEYCNRHWTPMHFADVASTLQGARLSYVGPANPLDHIDTMNLSLDQITMLRDTHDWQYRETLRDLFLNQQFRRDIWVKGPTRLDPAQADQRLKDLPIVAQKSLGGIGLKARVGRGEITIKPDLFQPLADFIAKEGRTTIGAVASVAQAHGGSLRAVLEGIALFTANQDIAIGCTASAAARERAQRYNAVMARETAFTSRENMLHFAAPATGGGVTLPRINAMALGAALHGARGPQRIDAIIAMLAQNGQKLSADAGGPSEREIVADVVNKTDALMPVLRGLGIFPADSAATTAAPAIPSGQSAAA